MSKDHVLYYSIYAYPDIKGGSSDLKVSRKGRVAIPAKIRKKCNVKSGSEVHVLDYGGVLATIPAQEGNLTLDEQEVMDEARRVTRASWERIQG